MEKGNWGGGVTQRLQGPRSCRSLWDLRKLQLLCWVSWRTIGGVAKSNSDFNISPVTVLRTDCKEQGQNQGEGR